MRIRRAIILPALLAFGVAATALPATEMAVAAGQATVTHTHVVAASFVYRHA